MMDNCVVDNFQVACFACPDQGRLQPVSNNSGVLLDEFEELRRRIVQSKWGHIEPAPILAFPNEITLLIFSFACDRSRLLYHEPNLGEEEQRLIRKRIRKMAQEMTISHVCHAWREISLDYSLLWSTFNHFARSPIVHLTDRLTTYLARAKEILVDLWAYISSLDVLQCLFKILAANSARWRRISLTFNKTSVDGSPTPTGPVNTMFLKQIASFQNLETFDTFCPSGVHIDSIPEGDQVDRTTTTIGSRMTSLRVDRRLFLGGLLLHSPKLHQNRLSHLQLDSGPVGQQRLPWTNFLLVLSELTNLVSLSLSKLIFDPPQGHPTFKEISAVTAPKLQYFRCADKHVAMWMWLYFRAPQLKLLSFNRILICDIHLGHSRYVVHHMHEHVFPSLKTLAFTDCLFHCVLSPDGMRFVINASRNITHLKISYTLSTAAAHKTPLYWMTQVLPQREVWPHLNTVSVIRRRLQSNENFPDREYIYVFLERIIERKRRLNQFCKLRMHNNLARQWAVKYPVLWSRMVTEGLFEHLPPSVPDDAGHWLTEWPPMNNTNFHWTSEISFLS